MADIIENARSVATQLRRSSVENSKTQRENAAISTERREEFMRNVNALLLEISSHFEVSQQRAGGDFIPCWEVSNRQGVLLFKIHSSLDVTELPSGKRWLNFDRSLTTLTNHLTQVIAQLFLQSENSNGS